MPVSVEYSKSSRSSCRGRGCSGKIEAGALRVVEVSSSGRRGGRGGRFGGFSQTRFFHLKCYPRSSFARDQVQGLAQLRPVDQARVVGTLCGKGANGQQTPSGSTATSVQLAQISRAPAMPSVTGAERVLSSVNAGALPAELVQKLMPFQKQGVAYALSVCKGRVLIGDEMGLGKTVQAITFALAYRQEWPALIVTPSSVKLNWADELEQWAPSLEPGSINIVKSRSYAGNLQAPITIVTYGMFAGGSAVVQQLTEQKFKVVILDESHYIKSRTAVRTKMLMPILQNAKRLALLSGTPALARPIELWTQVSALRPDLFPAYTRFTNMFCNPRRMPWGMDLNGSSNLDTLHDLLQRCMVRRLKAQVLKQLPAKRRKLVRLDVKNMAVVKDLRNKLRDVDLASLLSRGAGGGDAATTSELMDARAEQRALLSQLYTETGACKIAAAAEYVLEMVEGAGKLIVFAHHHAVLDGLQAALTRKKIRLVRVDGRTPSQERHANVKSFQDPDAGVQVALLGLTSAGQGITLTAASTVVFVELHWTPGVLIQAEDRAHRIGQKDSVNVSYLLASGSLDDIVWPLVCRKLDTVGRALDGAGRVQMTAALDPKRPEPRPQDPARTSCEGEGEGDEATGQEKAVESFPDGDMRAWLVKRSLSSRSTPDVTTPTRKALRTSSTPASAGAQSRTPSKRKRDAPATEPATARSGAAKWWCSGSPPPKLLPLDQVLDLTDSAPAETLSVCIEGPAPHASLFSSPQDSGKSRKGSSVGGGAAPMLAPRGAEVLSLEIHDSEESEDEIEDSDNGGSSGNPAWKAPDPAEKEGERLQFCVSGNTERLFLFKADGTSLGVNFGMDVVRDSESGTEVWTKLGLPAALAESPSVRETIRTFVRQWDGLRAVERKELHDVRVRPPLMGALRKLRAAAASQGQAQAPLCFERYIDRSEAGGESSGAECLECGRAVPAALRTAGVRGLCSYTCYQKRGLKLNSSTIRRQLFELERGVCQICGEDAQALYERIKALTPPERYQILVGSKYSTSHKLLENPHAGDFWNADHINPVALGGGQCGLDNFRTLCTPCHELETRKLRQTLRASKLAEAAGTTRDIRKFFASPAGSK